MPSMIETIKKCAVDAVDASDPTRIYFGTVVSASPLSIKIDQKYTISSEFIVLTRNVTDYQTWVTASWKTENKSVPHSHSTPDGETGSDNINHNHEISLQKKEITIHNALKVGERVILAQAQGGQKYVVLDRIGGNDTSGQ